MQNRYCITLAIFCSVLLSSAGCTPKVSVRKTGSDFDRGIRYYRPKPYLLVSPAGASVSVEEVDDDNKKSKKTTTTQSDEFVSIQLQYLPDFSEEYSIDVRPGLGTANVSFKLENGWNLTELNQVIDSQFDENIGAISELIKAGGSFLTPTSNAVDPSKGQFQPTEITTRWVVQATNVPLGYYEAVVGGQPGCGKQLYGWKYVGFAPFNSCPTSFCGGRVPNCESDPCGTIYGLAFENGVMMFQELTSLQANPNPSYRVQVPTGTVKLTRDNNHMPQGDGKHSTDTSLYAKLENLLIQKGAGDIFYDVIVESTAENKHKVIVVLYHANYDPKLNKAMFELIQSELKGITPKDVFFQIKSSSDDVALPEATSNRDSN